MAGLSFTQQGSTPQGGLSLFPNRNRPAAPVQPQPVTPPQRSGGFSLGSRLQPQTQPQTGMTGGFGNIGSIRNQISNDATGGIKFGKPTYQGVFGQSGVPASPSAQISAPGTGAQSSGGSNPWANTGGGTSGGNQQGGPAPTPTPQPGTPGYFAGVQSGIVNRQLGMADTYAPRIAAPYGQPGIAEGQKRLSDYELSRYNAQLTGLNQAGTLNQGLLNASLPQGYSYQSNVINPITGQSYGAGATGAGNGPGYGGTTLGQQAQGQQAQEYRGAHNAALNLQNQLGTLISGAGINPSNISALNSFINRVSTNVSDPNYQTFNNIVNDLASRYSVILTPQGGSTSDYRTQIAHSLINSAQSGQSIMQVLDSLNKQAEGVIGGVQSASEGNYGGSSGSTGGGFSEQW
jgi:hypothetical protein